MKVINVEDGIMKCEHCRTKTIKRIYTVVDENNDTWLVGSDCVNTMVDEENRKKGHVGYSRHTKSSLDRMVWQNNQNKKFGKDLLKL